MKLGAIILGQRPDPHVAAVESRLRAAGVDVRILDQYRDQGAIDMTGDRPVWPLDDWIGGLDGAAVWIRVKGPMGDLRAEWAPQPSAAIADTTRNFWRAEWRAYTRALLLRWLAHPHVTLINRTTLSGDAACKPIQLANARAAGLRIPSTLIGNAEADIDRTFGDAVLFKPLTAEPAGPYGPAMPAMLAKADVLAEGRASIAPAIFQTRIEKAYELRVTVAGRRITAVRIESQASATGRLDWRHAQHRKDLFRPADLDAGLAGRLLAYMELMQLDFGAFDLAVDPAGEAVFFECNPEGQWAWLGLDGIADDVASMIRDRARASALAAPKATAPSVA